jgi:hypothetical protein
MANPSKKAPDFMGNRLRAQLLTALVVSVACWLPILALDYLLF